MSRLVNLYFLIFFSFITASVNAQTKYEKEVRMNQRDVPEDARSFISGFDFDRKIRWYREYGLNKTSIEAKTKYKRKKYSIEFSNEGLFEDLEIEVDWKKLPKELKDEINLNLYSKFEFFSIDKIQSQFLGSPEKVRQFIKDETSENGITINYEIVLSTKVDRTFKQYEFLFSSDGKFIKSIEIAKANRDNTEY